MKQRYILDYDDLVQLELFTDDNTSNLINGVNLSAPGPAFAVPVGGTGNTTFQPGQTVVFDGQKLTSSGYGPMTPVQVAQNYDDRYYTKAEIDAFFASLASSGGFPVAYANLTNTPPPGIQVKLLDTPDVPHTATGVVAVMASPAKYTPSWPVPSGKQIVGVLVNVNGGIAGPDGGTPAQVFVSANADMTKAVLAGTAWAAGSGDAVAFCSSSICPCNPLDGSFYYQHVTNAIYGSLYVQVYGFLYQ